MTDLRLPKGAHVRLGAVDGNLIAEHGVTIDGENGASVIIAGDATFAGDATVRAPFECRRLITRKGQLRFESAVTVRESIDADRSRVEVVGPLTCPRTEVDRELRLHADSSVGRLDVGGSLTADGALRGETLHVGGALEVRGSTTAEEVSVGGKAELAGVDLARFAVGGFGTVGSGTIRERVEVGGKFSRACRAVAA